jgi:DHA1 family bicyclomycin/chloramphenicol resistance-like MFS transporter
MALNALAIDILLPALPAMGEALHVVDENQRPFVLSAYLIGFGIAQLFFGPISDRFGRIPPLMVGLAIYVAAAGFAAVTPHFYILLGLRFIQGIGAAATRVVAQSSVRDQFHGREMAKVMSLIFMVFMVIPVLAPSVGQGLLYSGHWQMIFFFMAIVAAAVGLWAWFRLAETLSEENRRPLTANVIIDGFLLVISNRTAFFYGLSAMFVMGALFGFISTASQVYLELYKLGGWFSAAFALVGTLMAVSSFLNSRIVGKVGMRRLAHSAIIIFSTLSGVWLLLALHGPIPFPLYLFIFTVIMFTFGLSSSNINALAMEPLGAVAGTASSVFGFMQTAGGAAIGGTIAYIYNGTVVPIAAGFFFLSLISIGCILIAEKGKLFRAVNPPTR